MTKEAERRNSESSEGNSESCIVSTSRSTSCQFLTNLEPPVTPGPSPEVEAEHEGEVEEGQDSEGKSACTCGSACMHDNIIYVKLKIINQTHLLF